ncbi:hypothetical protein GGF31_007873 [Allomyces arbusculus]|nr:hypothetical protein GGF31_007873 [Allomyces arbusculus]
MNISRIPGSATNSSSIGSHSPAGVAQIPRPAPPPARPSAWRTVIRVFAASVPHVATLTALALLGLSTLAFPPTSPASASSLQYVVAAAAIVAVAHVATHTTEHLRPPDPTQRVRNLERLSGRRVVAAAVSVPMHALVLFVAVRAVADVPENAVLGAGVVVHAVALGIVVGRVLEVPRIEDEIHAARHVEVMLTQSRRSLARHEDWDTTESRESSAGSSVRSRASRRASAMSLLEKLAVASSALPSDADQVRDSTSISSRWVYGSTAVGTLTAGTTAGTVDRATRAAAVLKAIKLAEVYNGTNVDKTGAVGQVASSLPRGTAVKETAVPRAPTSPGGTPVAARKYVPKRRYSMSNVHAGGMHEGVSAQSLRSQAGVAHASTSSTTSPRRRETMHSSPRRSADPTHAPSASQSTTSTASTGRSRRASANDVPTTRRTPSATTSNLHAFMAAHHIVEFMSDERLATEAQPPPSRASDAAPQAPPPTRRSSGTVTAAPEETDSFDSLVASSPAPAAGRQPVPSEGRRARSATATAESSTFRPKHVVNSCPTIVVVPPPSPVLDAVGAAQGGEETGERIQSAGMLSAETGGRRGT